MSDKLSKSVENLNRSGRKKGIQNKLSRSVKEAFAQAFSDMQDDPAVALVAWGKANPTEFYKLAAKLIPTEIGGNVGIDLAEILSK